MSSSSAARKFRWMYNKGRRNATPLKHDKEYVFVPYCFSTDVVQVLPINGNPNVFLRKTAVF